jgi:hypothetical protein
MVKNKQIMGYAAHPSKDFKYLDQTYEPINMPEVSLNLYSLAKQKVYNPFDLGYHSHNLCWPYPHSKVVMRHMPKEGFWRNVGIDG